MTTVAGGPIAPSADSVDLANTRVRSLVYACARWAQDFADAVFRSTILGLPRVTTNKGAIMTDKKEQRATCLDLSGVEFQLGLHDLNAPPDKRRWSLALKDGELSIRLWTDNMMDCKCVTITRVGTQPTVTADLRNTPDVKIAIDGEEPQ